MLVDVDKQKPNSAFFFWNLSKRDPLSAFLFIIYHAKDKRETRLKVIHVLA